MPTPTSPAEAADLVLAAVEARAVATDVLSPPEDGRTPVSFTAMWAYAADPAARPDPAVVAACAGGGPAAADFARLLANTARVRFPRVAAASTGGVSQRIADGCRISFRASRAEPDQVYVIVERDDEAEAEAGEAVLFVGYPDNRFLRLVVPPGRDGRSQVILDAGSDIVRALRDVTTEVYLK